MYPSLKFKYLDLEKIQKDYNGFAIFVDGSEVLCGDIWTIKNLQISMRECEVVATRTYFDLFVIELKS